VCICVCVVCMSQLIHLLQSPPSLVRRGLIYAVAMAILRRTLKCHHSSAPAPVCSLTLPLAVDSSSPGVIYQALKRQTKAPRHVCRAGDGLIDKHFDSRTEHKERVNFITAWDKVRTIWTDGAVRGSQVSAIWPPPSDPIQFFNSIQFICIAQFHKLQICLGGLLILYT